MKLNSISNNRLTLLRKLNQKKYRQKERLFFVEGGRAVKQILENKELKVVELFFDESQQYWQQKEWKLYSKVVSASIIATEDFVEVSDTDNPQGVIALCQIPDEADLEALAQQKGIMLATDAVQDPGNMGTIIRTAGWFGVNGLLSGKGTVDIFHPKVVRSTSGATGTVPYAMVELADVLSFFEANGWQTILLDAGADSVDIKGSQQQQEKIILIVGNEANGIDRKLFESGREKVRIDSPARRENVESLNAAVATSIALYALT